MSKDQPVTKRELDQMGISLILATAVLLAAHFAVLVWLEGHDDKQPH